MRKKLLSFNQNILHSHTHTSGQLFKCLHSPPNSLIFISTENGVPAASICMGGMIFTFCHEVPGRLIHHATVTPGRQAGAPSSGSELQMTKRLLITVTKALMEASGDPACRRWWQRLVRKVDGTQGGGSHDMGLRTPNCYLLNTCGPPRTAAGESASQLWL